MTGVDRPATLRALRKRLGLTQIEMAQRLGLKSADPIQRYELGQVAIPGPVWMLIEHQRVALGDEL